MTDIERARQRLREAGFERLAETYAEAAALALAQAEAMIARLPADLGPAEEPAHVFRADVFRADAPRANGAENKQRP